MILQFAFVVVIFLGYPFFPESPYLLLKKGQEEKARHSLARIHGSRDQALIDAEMSRIKQLVEVSENLEVVAAVDGWPMIQIWKKPNRVCCKLCMSDCVSGFLTESTETHTYLYFTTYSPAVDWGCLCYQ